jgi:hypothetical protein
MAPGGNHKIAKDLLTPPREHVRRYKEMLRIAEQLPPGEKQPPSEKLAIQWYYMTYHRADRVEYAKSGKNLTGYSQALFMQKKADGTLERAEIDRLHNRAKKRLASNLREKREAHRTSYARRELRERGRRDGSRSYRHDDDSNYRDDRDRPTIEAHEAPTDADRNATDAAIATISRKAGAARAESAGSAVRATTAVRMRQKGRGREATTVAATRRAAVTNVCGERDRCRRTRTTSTLAPPATAKATTKTTPSRAKARRRAKTTTTTISPWRWLRPPNKRRKVKAMA